MKRSTLLSALTLALVLASCAQTPAPSPSTDSTEADIGGHTGHSHSNAFGDLTNVAPGPDLSKMPTDARLREANVLRGTRLGPQALPTNAQTSKVALKVLVLSSGAGDYGLDTAVSMLKESGVPYDVLDASQQTLTMSTLIDGSGIGRYQGIILTSNALYLPDYTSALDTAEWSDLFAYEKAYSVRQLALYGYPGVSPEDYGLRAVNSAATSTTSMQPVPGAQSVFSDLTGTPLPVQYAWTYPSTVEPVAGVVTTPLMVDPNGLVLAATSTVDGRERLLLTTAQNPALMHTQLMSYGLLQWLTKGVHLGEHRRFFQADIDDYFLSGDHLNATTRQLEATPFRLSASDALSLRDQQTQIQQQFPVASGFRYAMAFNGGGANINAPLACTDPGSSAVDGLTSVTKCIKGSFDWVNHTRDHLRMDVMNLSTAYAQIIQNVNIGNKLGLTLSRKSLVTGEHSGLGNMDPTDDGTHNDDDVNLPKQDLGLDHSNPNVLTAAVNSRVSYLASDHSVASHWDASCPTCGVQHPMNSKIFLVPRWPNNVHYHVTNPDEAMASYNSIYAPGGTRPYWDHALSYSEFLDKESDLGLTHILDGGAFPHYMHQTNLHEYAPGTSLATDWVKATLSKYSLFSTLPVNTYRWDDLGNYLQRRTLEEKAKAKGTLSAVWDRKTFVVTLTSTGGTVPVTITGSLLGTPYGAYRIQNGNVKNKALVLVVPQITRSAPQRRDPPDTTAEGAAGHAFPGGSFFFRSPLLPVPHPPAVWRTVFMPSPLRLLAAALLLLTACKTGPPTQETSFAPPPGGEAPRAPVPEVRLPANAQPDRVQLRVLVLDTGAGGFGIGTARALLRSHGIPFTELDVTARPLTAATLIDAQGVGRYQGVVLTSSGLSVETTPGVYASALDPRGWATLFAYEKAYGVRQLALFGYPGSQPEDYGLRADGDVQTDDTTVSLTPAGRKLFSDLSATPLPVHGAARYPARRTAVKGVGTTPLITDPHGGVLAATSTADGRERLLLTLAQNPGMLHTQFLGHGLVQWLTRGVYLGEYRRFLQVDVDDWFLYADRFDPATGQVVPRDYRLGAADALSLRDQQRRIRQEYAVARGFRLAQAFNGLGADPGAPDTCRPGPEVRDPLSAVTRCIAGSFDWVNHTKDHLLMDTMSEEKAVSEMVHNREIGRQLGLPLSGQALITPELSGLGWKAPSPGAAKQDFGLAGGNPAVYRAARQLGLRYLAANHSVPSQWDPACPNCGVSSPLDPDALLIPRWPNDVPYNATTPAEAVGVFNARRTPSGKAPLNYAAFLEQDTARSLVHVLSGTAWPHYMHQGNLREYAPDRSLVTDWVRALLDRYARHSTLPLQTLTWNDLGAYVRDRTRHERAKNEVSAVWDRRRGQVTLRARGPGQKDGFPVVFLTGVAGAAQDGETRTFTYGARTTAQLRLGSQALSLSVAPLEPAP